MDLAAIWPLTLSWLFFFLPLRQSPLTAMSSTCVPLHLSLPLFSLITTWVFYFHWGAEAVWVSFTEALHSPDFLILLYLCRPIFRSIFFFPHPSSSFFAAAAAIPWKLENQPTFRLSLSNYSQQKLAKIQDNQLGKLTVTLSATRIDLFSSSISAASSKAPNKLDPQQNSETPPSESAKTGWRNPLASTYGPK